jgi:hypothetical protein
MNIRTAGRLLALLGVLLAPSFAFAQTSGTIAGIVKDTSGAVLPGATVEASSPALIEKVRTAVTDGTGNYKIVDLRPGVYTVTVTMPGFGTYKREGLDLSAGVTANVSADLKVGSLEETVTVTGATPIVDVQSARTQNVMKSETLDALPSGSRNLMAFAAMTLGAMPSSGGRNDVGGDKGEQASGIILHGGRGDDGRVNWDGMSTNVFFGGGGGQQRTYYFNTVAVQEVVVDTAGSTADTETGGANINMVPREGGNSLKLYSNLAFTNESLSAESVPDNVAARGFAAQSSLRKIWDYGVGVGGKIVEDKAWFYGTYRNWGAQNYGNVRVDADTNPLTYTPGTDRAFANTYFADESFRVTWQLNQKHKINHEFHLQYGCSCDLGIGGGALQTSEASTDFNYGPQVLNQTTWNWTASNKLLVQAGASFLRQEVNFMNTANRNIFTGKADNVFAPPGTFAITDVATGFSFGAIPGGFTNYGVDDNSNNFNQKVSVNYITGSHAMKFGLQTIQGKYDIFGMQGGVEQINLQVRSGVPVGVRLWAGPFQSLMDLGGQGLFAQDQWTIKKLTLNYGARYDRFVGSTPAQDIAAGPFRPAFSVPAQASLPNFQDFTYRAAAAYDVFGNGKTAIKAGFGKYLMGQGGALAQQGFSRSFAIAGNTDRTWNDANGNNLPDCVQTNPAANGECGAYTNPVFGQTLSFASLDPDWVEGWGKREYNYQWNVQLQQELRPGIGLAVGYFHTQWGNMSVTRNTRLTTGDYTSYCINSDAQALGGFGGKQVCGFYDQTPASLAKGNFFQIERAQKYASLGSPEDYFNGVDVGINARWGKGALLTGGVSVGRQIVDYCYVNSRPDLTPQGSPMGSPLPGASRYPRNDDFCNVTPSWWDGIGSQVKLQFVYPLPGDVNVSASYKHLPGIAISGNQILANAQITGILGRPSISGGTTSHSVIPTGSGNNNAGGGTAEVFDERLNQLDLRFSKNLKIGKGKIQGIFDVYNVANARTPQSSVSNLGAAYQRIISTLGGRLFKFNAVIDF